MPGGHGWLTTLADLALILFIVTAAELAQTEQSRAEQKAGQIAEQAADGTADAQLWSVDEAPLALYRQTPETAPFTDWLAGYPADPRQRLTIRISYRDGGRDAAMARGFALESDAERAGWTPRLIVEAAEQTEVSAMLTFDRAEAPPPDLTIDAARAAATTK